jgi:TolB-like protein/class 3 adenylate cyclase
MPLAREQRKLAAIIAADVVGYSRLMGRDESGTLARLRKNRSEHLDPVLTKYGGRLVKLTGDGALIEFASAVDALSAAIEFQQAMAKANSDQPADTALVFRMGLHLGDLIVDGDDLYGDGVNVAARLEGEAPAGGVLISRTVHEAVTGRLKATFDDLGTLALKNIERPVQAFSVKWEQSDWQLPIIEVTVAPATAPQMPLPLPDKPSIAVLPFQNMSGDPEQEYFSDGMVEEVITALSRNKSLFVIARNSSFSYKGKSPDIRQVGRELGVRYVLEGSVRKAGNRVRVTGQLVECDTGAHLWADKFDNLLEDVFELQDRVATTVAAAIEPSVTQAEVTRARRKPTENLLAYDWLLRAIGEQRFTSREHVDRGIAFARRALDLDPQLARACSLLAFLLLHRRIYGWMQDEPQEIAEGVHFAHKAVEFEPNDPVVLTDAAFALAHLNSDMANSIPWLDRSIAINPNSAYGYGLGAVVRVLAGQYETAERHVDLALRLSPFDPMIYVFYTARGVSHLFRRQLPQAILWLTKSVQENPLHGTTPLHLSSALAHAGRLDEAHDALQHALKLRPMISVKWMRQRRYFQQADDYEYFLDGARLAGLPE